MGRAQGNIHDSFTAVLGSRRGSSPKDGFPFAQTKEARLRRMNLLKFWSQEMDQLSTPEEGRFTFPTSPKALLSEYNDYLESQGTVAPKNRRPYTKNTFQRDLDSLTKQGVVELVDGDYRIRHISLWPEQARKRYVKFLQETS